MKKLAIIALALLMVGSIFAETMLPDGGPKPVDSPKGYRMPHSRQVPSYSFSIQPTALLTNYYDYMIGSYNHAPMQVIPDVAGGGYFATYHARRQPSSTRRTFYTYIDAQGTVLNNNEITETQIHEGFPTLSIDPVSGKPFYAWHVNADADANLETVLVYDQFIAGIAGIFGSQYIIGDAPMEIDPPSFPPTTDNEFIWPTSVIGPSPVAGKRRLYVGMTNYVTHANGARPASNWLIAYTDFDGDDIEFGNPLTFNHVTVPMLDDWNNDPDYWRRSFLSIMADDSGNLYLVGYHFAYDGDDVEQDEPNVDVFRADNYGQGTWEHLGHYGSISTWNPPEAPGSTVGYFTNDSEVPYPDDALSFDITNSTHLNGVFDNLGRIHFPGLWALSTNEGTYYPNIQFAKSMVFDPDIDFFEIKEVYPVKDPTDDYNECFTPWDIEAPWGEVDEYGGDATSGYFPLIVTDWDFPHWDSTAHDSAMEFHYNNYKMTHANSEGWMAALWQNSYRARMFNEYSDADYTDWANVPEIYVAVSRDNGNTWYEPIVLNNIETPQMAGIKPMWVYPADKMIQVSEGSAKLGIFFYDDYTWGSQVQSPPYHPTADGGRTMFMELLIDLGEAGDDPQVPELNHVLHQNYPNPFNPETTINFDLPRTADANLSIYNLKGQLVKTLVNDQLNAGRQSYVWDGTDAAGNAVSSGVYFYRLDTMGTSISRKMILMK